LRVFAMRMRNFRGMSDLTIRPRGHAVLVGPPGCGRTTVVDALTRVLDADSTRGVPSDDLDFHRRDITQPLTIEVILGDLGDELREHFLYRTEPWDPAAQNVVAELDAALADRPYERVLRLGYRAVWLPHEERVDHCVYYLKGSNPDTDDFERVWRADRKLLPFIRVGSPSGALTLTERSDFRRLVEHSEYNDLSASLSDVRDVLSGAAEQIASSDQVRDAITAATEGIDELLPLVGDPTETIRLIPGGTSLSALLRSLIAEFLTRDGPIPLYRAGSATSAILAVAQAIATVSKDRAVVAVDDLGEGMDASAAAHLAGLLVTRSDQAWISTRQPGLAATFDTDQVIRLHFDESSSRCAAQLPAKACLEREQRVTLRHLGPQLVRAAAGHVVVIVEGIDDADSIEALSHRVLTTGRGIGLSAVRATVVHPGSLQQSGGHGATARFARAAALWQLRRIIVVDGDTDKDTIQSALEAACAVIRLPEDFAIERTLLYGIDPNVCVPALRDLAEAFSLDVKIEEQPDQAAIDWAGRAILKKKGQGLHSTFIAALPDNHLPNLGIRLITAIVDAARGRDGLIQLEASS